jgi:hydroxymethylbilane synthase
MNTTLRIGTRDSQLAVWQATQVQQLLQQYGYASELVYIKSDGDSNLVTPLYELGVQGVFTKTLDAALLSGQIDIAVHSMKDVPTQLAGGIIQAAVLPRASYKDLFIYKDQSVIDRLQLNNTELKDPLPAEGCIATSSIRRKTQWLHRYPHYHIENLRGNINTRLRKVRENNWDGAIFATAGVERIHLRPENAVELDWMLPAPAQGAIIVVCREKDTVTKNSCVLFNDASTALCTRIERDFLRQLAGGCSTPISALAEIKNNTVTFRGNIYSLDGKEKVEIVRTTAIISSDDLGTTAANELLNKGAYSIVEAIRYATK